MVAKRSAVAGLKKWWLNRLSESLRWLIQGLLQHWLKGELLMDTLTADALKERGKHIKELLLPLLDDQQVKELLLPLLTDQELSLLLKDTAYIEQVRAEGRLEGEQKAWDLALDNIRQTLAIRFEISLTMYDARLKKLGLPALEKLNQLAFTIAVLTEFETALTEFETELNT